MQGHCKTRIVIGLVGMSNSVILPLVNNATLLLALGMLYELIGIHRPGAKPTARQVLSGFLLGLMSIAVMMNALRLGEGVIFDTRSVLLSLSGLFFGVLPTAIATTIAAGFRLYQGGAGAWTGVYVILATGSIGLLWRHLRSFSSASISFRELLFFGFLVHIVMLLLMFTLPGSLPSIMLSQIAIPVLGIYPLSTALLGWLMATQSRRREAEQNLRESEARYRSLFANNHAVMLLIDPTNGQIVDVNPAAEQFYGGSRAELLAKKISEINALSAEEVRAEMERAKAQLRSHFLFKHRLASGEIRDVEVYSGTIQVGGRSLLYSIVHDITQRVEAERERSLLTDILTASLNEIYLFDAQTLQFRYVNQGALKNLQMTAEQVKQLTPLDLKPHFDKDSFEQLLLPLRRGEQPKIVFETVHRRADGSLYPVEVHLHYFQQQGCFLAVINDITERRKTDELLRKRLKELDTVSKISAALRKAETTEEFLPLLLDETLSIFESQDGAIWLFDSKQQVLRMVLGRGWFKEMDESANGWGSQLLRKLSSQPQASFSPLLLDEHQLGEIGNGNVPPSSAGICCPLRTTQELLGMLIIAMPSERPLLDEESHLLVSISEIAGSALHRMRLHEETLKRLSQLQALRTIDQAISSVVDLPLTLDVVCAQALAQLGADAVGALVFSAAEYAFKFSAGRGFRGQAYPHATVILGEGLAGKAARERSLIHVPNLAVSHLPFDRQQVLDEERFISYAVAPLVARGQLKGLLEVFHRTPFNHPAEWLETLQSFALQAAIAIENVQMFDHLQQLNAELIFAYDATIEGWSRALDLKDKETEGHSQRVVDWTLKLAQAMGVSEKEFIHLRRGALLHDIGKMGIPDSILLKSGPLDEEEWQIIKKHPQYAFEWLSSISYLRPALDIPYCHHEKWDGSGYPRGLKGLEIPLAARIFAVIDVWDALTSDRPYRKAWSRAKALEYIQEQADKHFDPHVVKVFFENIERFEHSA